MTKDEKSAGYEALKTKNTELDGHLFVGVSSTGIYCRPICRAKRPKPENCTFYATAAQAEKAGYRPCLLCRPELAPGTPLAAGGASLADRAVRYLEEYCGTLKSVKEVSGLLQCDDRHLRESFVAQFKVSLEQYLKTLRLHLAKTLLTDTCLSVDEIAQVSGLGHGLRLEELFRKDYRMASEALRRRNRSKGGIDLPLNYRPPFEWDQLLRFFTGRAISGVELVKGGKYFRTVRLLNKDGCYVHGEISVRQEAKKDSLTVTVSPGLLPVISQVLSRVRHLFDLRCDPLTVFEGLSPMDALGTGLRVAGLRVPGCFDPFEMAVRAVLGQQITVKAAGTLAGRFTKAFGVKMETGVQGLTHAFPTPQAILALDGPIEEHLGPLGITTTRAKAILGLAQAVATHTVNFDFWADPEAEIKKLMDIPGIGIWTAQYIAMRTLGWQDAFPHTDYGVKKALAPRTPKEILDLAESWRPWRGYAAINLWNSL